MPTRILAPMAAGAILALAAGCSETGRDTASSDERAGETETMPTERPEMNGSGDTQAGSAPDATPSSDAGDTASGIDGFALPFVATGNEPGWRLEIGAGQMRLDWQYGEKSAQVATPEPGLVGGVRTYDASADGRDIRATIRESLCQDAAGKFPKPYSVEVDIGDETLSGCGGDPSRLLMGDEWVVETVNGEPIIAQTRMSVRFETDGTLSGYDSCNPIGGSWQLVENTLKIDPLASANEVCPEPLVPQQSAFTKILETGGRFGFSDGGALVVFGEGDQTFRARQG